MGDTPAQVGTSAARPATPKAGQAADVFTVLVVTGVRASGKTTIATALAQRLGWPLQEGDELHPRPDIARIVRVSARRQAPR
jgi:hypothetical protein